MLPIQRKISAYNHFSSNDIKYLVIHDVGTVSSAKNNVDYFSGGNRGASAHYFVDDSSIWQSVEDYHGAWHVGDGYGAYGISNTNSIGIEMCLVAPLTVTNTTVNNTLELTRFLMKKYNIPASRVVRHYDASRKMCPNSFSANGWAKWNDFKSKLASNGSNITPKPPVSTKYGTIALHATHYQTGQKIASFIKGNKYPILEEKKVNQSKSKKAYLMGTIMSWVLEQDLVEYAPKTTSKPSNSASMGKVTVLANELWYYNKPDWNALYKTVKKGEVFTVTDKVKVDGYFMYKLKSGNYITASEKYVKFSK